jgi:hypothetical protein
VPKQFFFVELLLFALPLPAAEAAVDDGKQPPPSPPENGGKRRHRFRPPTPHLAHWQSPELEAKVRRDRQPAAIHSLLGGSFGRRQTGQGQGKEVFKKERFRFTVIFTENYFFPSFHFLLFISWHNYSRI